MFDIIILAVTILNPTKPQDALLIQVPLLMHTHIYHWYGPTLISFVLLKWGLELNIEFV